MIRQFFEGFRKLSKTSFLFHFDFSVAVNSRESKAEKPKGIFESLLVMLSRLLSRMSKAIGHTINESLILTALFKWIGSYHRTPFLSAAFFVLGFLGVFLMRQTNLALGLAVMGGGCLVILVSVSLAPYYRGSMIQKGVDFIVKGGDPS